MGPVDVVRQFGSYALWAGWVLWAWTGWGARWVEAWRGARDANVVQDLGDRVAVLDDRDEFAAAAAAVTFQNVD